MKNLQELIKDCQEGKMDLSHLMAVAEQFDALYENVMVAASLGSEQKPSRDFQRASRKVLDAIYLNILSIEKATENGEKLPTVVLSEEDKQNINKTAMEFGIRPTWVQL